MIYGINNKKGEKSHFLFKNIINSLSGTTLSGSLNYTYDNNGNLKNDGEKTFSYDYKNRLTKVETGSGIIAQYSYDVLNRRYLKETENEKVEYIYSNENILQEITTDEITNTTITKNYINGIGLDDLVAYQENNNIYYYHKNHLGSVEGITDSSGNIVVSYDYDSFGNFEITSGADNGNTRLYTGREHDSEIGLYYLRARYYNSELGRFISRDPIDISDDVNLYSYVGNNGVNFVDRSGFESKQLQEDINNKNTFVIKLVARGLNNDYKGLENYLIHTFIDITSYGKNGIINNYTIGGYWNTVTGELDGEFNKKVDLYWNGIILDSKIIPNPKGIEGYEFTQNILNEYYEYEKKQKDYWIGGAITNTNNFGNCNNYSTTILTNSALGSLNTLDSINSFDPIGINLGIGTNFKEKIENESIYNQFIKGYSELEYYLINLNRAF
ncbi:MAG: hypothetical protein PHV23_03020 [Candidatus Gracilibacteria bacterium]|nr:hypothetical protein [Candidatus Gracilibacteria bacterium]